MNAGSDKGEAVPPGRSDTSEGALHEAQEEPDKSAPSADSPITAARTPTHDKELPGEPTGVGISRIWSSYRVVRGALRVVQLGPVVILALLVIVMTILSPVFLTERNFTILGVQTSIVAVLALGQFLVILTRGIDLSMGSVLALSSVTGALVANTAIGSGATAVVAMALAGAAVGFVNGAVLVWGRIPHPFIITLATLTIARGLALTLAGGSSVTPVPPLVLEAGGGEIGGFPIPVLIVLGFAAFVGILTQRTRWGRWIYAVGGNPEGARRTGIPVNRVLILVYVLCGLSAGIAGLITTGRTGAGAPTAGNLAELDAITAVIIGGVSFFGGRGRMHNVLVGALIFGVIRNGLNLLSVDPFWQLIAIGVVIVIAVELDVLRQYLEGRFRVLSAGRV